MKMELFTHVKFSKHLVILHIYPFLSQPVFVDIVNKDLFGYVSLEGRHEL